MTSNPPISHEITRLLHRWEEGDREAFQKVVTLAYDDLRAIALGYLQRGAVSHTLQATGLVNELYLKLAQVRGAPLKDRRHFYAFAAQLMRMILIDYSRQAKALKRPSSAERVPLHEEMAWIDAVSEEMIALNIALDELEKIR
jgi:RNA polymerase sigma-70 factor, ECF subfamily